MTDLEIVVSRTFVLLVLCSVESKHFGSVKYHSHRAKECLPGNFLFAKVIFL